VAEGDELMRDYLIAGIIFALLGLSMGYIAMMALAR